jgi:SAM-dependent methyltransferase
MDPNGAIGDFFLETHVERIIDVGSGPLTAVGKTHPGKTISVTAVDPLASAYNRLMDEEGIEPPVRPIEGSGEKLLETFKPDSFDIAYALNAVDHAYDPVRVIENMLAVVRAGGYVVLVHRRREALRNCYRHLHQWNFEIRDGDLVIWRGTKDTYNMTEMLGPNATVECFDYGEWVLCSIAKYSAALG